MTTIKGPAIFLAQFAGDNAPYNTLEGICEWAASLGYKGIQIPTWDARLIDLQRAAEDKDYVQQLQSTVQSHGLEITELSTHLQGQLIAVHPSFDPLFDAFAPQELHNN
ncbi:MAG: sugar phosphate isomerase/epimerase, partial [Sphingobacterium sp.]